MHMVSVQPSLEELISMSLESNYLLKGICYSVTNSTVRIKMPLSGIKVFILRPAFPPPL